MAVKKYFSNKNKGWKFDAKEKKYWSYGFDIYLASGKRKCETGFPTKQIAENAVARIKLGEKNKKYELIDYRKFPTCAELFQKRVESVPLDGEKSRSRRVLQMVLDLIPADLRINDLTVSHINNYISLRQKEAVKDETINRDLRTVRAALNQAKIFFPDCNIRHLQFLTLSGHAEFLRHARSERHRVIGLGAGPVLCNWRPNSCAYSLPQSPSPALYTYPLPFGPELRTQRKLSGEDSRQAALKGHVFSHRVEMLHPPGGLGCHLHCTGGVWLPALRPKWRKSPWTTIYSRANGRDFAAT